MTENESIVAYLDVLGFKKWVWDLIDKDDGTPDVNKFEALGDSLTEALEQAVGTVQEAFIRKTEVGEVMTFQFSDSFVLAAESRVGIELPIIKGLVAFSGELLQEGLACRAGVARGYVYRDQNRGHLFGPAYLKAYQLESEIAFYPRIALEKSVATALLEILDNDPTAIERNSEKQAFVNLFSGCYEYWDPEKSDRARLAIKREFKEVKNRSDRLDLAAKWRWLKASWKRNHK